ncbi:hypothetical protein TVAG_351650 [Trichomonas vaginalis G3]|uniref:Uncharacterized protein n=1 Tax=Trichomonas vaginalis (strain ATCC PRA-98 / G3) TaxID=412133 RepID=A2DZP9_TRIV3|nr:regulation of DNA-templated transcription, elongation [Trichomonas vaginalis G3]EAY14117.1 hypothetical protein TVAG_351650 [Trichomonas vaginalis G3]KAI5525126.1 regulation of DNA-templated transcription, elongation [Trichomonas vaginalis G3]|eukprot:XP_001326340.1 hypothetical protein [Trichomonas vaginalis G3]
MVIFSADKFPESYSKYTIDKINALTSDGFIYETPCFDEFVLQLFIEVSENENLRNNIISMAYLPNCRNRLYIETDDPDKITSLCSKFQLSKIEITKFAPYLINFPYYRFYDNKSKLFARISVDPLKDEPCQILDINYVKKKAIVRSWSNIDKSKSTPIDEYTVTDSKALNTTQKVSISFDKTRYSDKGFIFHGEKFIGEYKISKIDMRQLYIWKSYIKPSEKLRFDHPIPGLRLLKQEAKPLKLKFKHESRMHGEVLIGKPKFNILLDVKPKYISMPYLYQLIEIDEETYGVITEIDIGSLTVLLNDNKLIKIPVNYKLKELRDDGTCRDAENRRMFIDDYVKILDGKFIGKEGRIIHARNKIILIGIYTDDKCKCMFIEAKGVKLIQDDEGALPEG